MSFFLTTDKIYHPLGEFNAAKVAGELNLAYALSTAGSQPISEVARVNDEGFAQAGRSRAHGAEKGRFFQLYWPPNDKLTVSLLRDAHENGYSACILTLDTWQLAWRHGDISAANYAFYVCQRLPDFEYTGSSLTLSSAARYRSRPRQGQPGLSAHVSGEGHHRPRLARGGTVLD
jgi:isopentenyl diphosphate isomerase/L-lactate dehydrogenase-like FMN-dependent dehydrogenase